MTLRQRNPASRAIANRKLGKSLLPGEKAAARELKLFLDNDFDLHRQQEEPIQKNLIRKIKKGIFDAQKSAVLYRHLVDNAAKKYSKEFGVNAAQIFPGPIRNAVARQKAAEFIRDFRTGQFSELDVSIRR